MQKTVSRIHLLLPFFVILVSAKALAAPESDLWAIWDAAADSSSETVDHGEWQQILDGHLKHEDKEVSLFDYGAVSDSEKKLLGQYLTKLQNVDPRTFSSDEQKAYWINLYNALTVQLIVENYPVSSITKLGKGFFKFGPWDDPIAEVAGQSLTLNDIEHRILRPIWQDPRIHFAVNCASIGCPNLQPMAFTAENSDELLEQGAIEYLSHPRGASFTSNGKLQLSSIFDWYGVDFGDSKTEILTTLSDWAPADVAEKMSSYSGNIDYEYDWSLNDASGK